MTRTFHIVRSSTREKIRNIDRQLEKKENYENKDRNDWKNFAKSTVSKLSQKSQELGCTADASGQGQILDFSITRGNECLTK